MLDEFNEAVFIASIFSTTKLGFGICYSLPLTSATVTSSYHAEFSMMLMKLFRSTVPKPVLLLLDACSTIIFKSSDESLTWPQNKAKNSAYELGIGRNDKSGTL